MKKEMKKLGKLKQPQQPQNPRRPCYYAVQTTSCMPLYTWILCYRSSIFVCSCTAVCLLRYLPTIDWGEIFSFSPVVFECLPHLKLSKIHKTPPDRLFLRAFGARWKLPWKNPASAPEAFTINARVVLTRLSTSKGLISLWILTIDRRSYHPFCYRLPRLWVCFRW